MTSEIPRMQGNLLKVSPDYYCCCLLIPCYRVATLEDLGTVNASPVGSPIREDYEYGINSMSGTSITLENLKGPETLSLLHS